MQKGRIWQKPSPQRRFTVLARASNPVVPAYKWKALWRDERWGALSFFLLITAVVPAAS